MPNWIYRRIPGVVFMVVIFGMSLSLLHAAGPELLSAMFSDTGSIRRTEAVAVTRFPQAETLRRLRVSLSYMSGSKEQNGVFLAKDGTLMLDVQPRSLTVSNKNVQAMLDLAESFGRPSYVMLVPTACAVLQSKVPYAEVAPLYNQRALIDSVYQRASGLVTAIDVYPTLFNHQNEYIYYGTANTLTGMGGYYVYTVAGKKLGLSRVRGIEEFQLEYLDYHYYGDLYSRSPYRAAEPDRVFAYSYAKSDRRYTVTHYDAGGERRYYTLYPKFRGELGDTLGILLGGTSPLVDIKIADPLNSRRLLVIGDRTVQSYLPFLMINYERVTIVDTASITPELLDEFDVADYNQVLFSYGVDSFVLQEQFSRMQEIKTP